MTHEPITKKEFNEAIDGLREQREKDINVLRDERKQDMKEIMELLKPLSDTYRSATTLGKWIMAAAVFVSILLSIILGLKALK